MLYNFTKRIIDIIGSIFGILILLPFFIVISIAVKITSPGSILAETPMRVGKDGKLFRMYKFRSMIHNAHQLLHTNPEFAKLLKEYQKNSYKIVDDPRVTPIGKYLRKYSIDEFPQFFNILKGEMSVVGPRAYYSFELEDQQKKYPESREFVKVILSAKPGLTGVWQVSGRSDINFDKRVELDARYVQRRSILYDLWIMIRTIPAVLFSRGAV